MNCFIYFCFLFYLCQPTRQRALFLRVTFERLLLVLRKCGSAVLLTVQLGNVALCIESAFVGGIVAVVSRESRTTDYVVRSQKG